MNKKIVVRLEKELSLVEDFVGLIRTSSEKALDVQLAVLRVLTQKNKNILFVSTTRPYSNIFTLLKQ